MNLLFKKILWSVLAALAALALVITAITVFAGDEENTDATPNPSPSVTREGMTGVIQVVTSTNVWASVIELVGGDWVVVTTMRFLLRGAKSRGASSGVQHRRRIDVRVRRGWGFPATGHGRRGCEGGGGGRDAGVERGVDRGRTRGLVQDRHS